MSKTAGLNQTAQLMLRHSMPSFARFFNFLSKRNRNLLKSKTY